MDPLAITAYSVVNCLGAGARALLDALRERRSGLRPCDFDGVSLDTWIGRVDGLDTTRVAPSLSDYDCRNNRLAQMGLRLDGFEARVAAARARYGAARIGVFVGTSTSGISETETAYRHRDPRSGALPPGFRYAGTHSTYSLADFVRRYLDLQGPACVVSAACASTAKVFGNAARSIAAGVCDAAVVGGADSLCFTTLCGFRSLELTSRNPCRPFDERRDGISIGEGAGFVLLERAGGRNGDDSIRLLGVGESADAYHMSTPHPEGLGARMAMQRALDSAAMRSSDVDYVNLHGTASRSNDVSEDRAVTSLFERAVPCSSTKGATGHLLGASGITEAVISILAIAHGLMPGSANTSSVDPGLKCHYLVENRNAPVKRVMSNSFGFGGSNCSLILGSAS